MSVKNKPKGLGRGLNAIFDVGDIVVKNDFAANS